MRDIYLIDFENVASDGLSGITFLTPEDEVIIFYSSNSNRLTMKMHILIGKSVCKLSYFEAAVGGKNALDHQIATWLGYLIGTGAAERNYYVVSRDAGYKFVASFWNEHELKPNVRCIDSIRAAGRLERSRQARENREGQKTRQAPEDKTPEQAKPEEKPQEKPREAELPEPKTAEAPQTDPVQAEQPAVEPQPTKEERPLMLSAPGKESNEQPQPAESRQQGSQKPARPQGQPENQPQQTQNQPQQAQNQPQSPSQGQGEKKKTQRQSRSRQNQEEPRRMDITALIAPYPDLQEQHLQQLIAENQRQKLCNHLRKHLGQEKGLALYNEIKKRAWH